VEGIAEALVLPELARLQYRGQETQRRHLAGVSFVGIDGVDFEPYLKLLLGGDARRVDKVVVVTDGDPVTKPTPRNLGDERRQRYLALYPEDARLEVFVGGTTLEAELFSMVNNEQLLKKAFLTMHPRSEKKWDDLFGGLGNDPMVRATAFAKAIRTKDGEIDLGKGDFAQLVCEAIAPVDDDGDDDEPVFVVPPYLNSAIAAVMTGVPGTDAKEADAVIPQ